LLSSLPYSLLRSPSPKRLEGAQFLRNTHKHQGAVEFRVVRRAKLGLAGTMRWGGGGSSRGDWKREAVTREQLQKDGWVALDAWMRAERAGHDGSYLDWEIFERVCKPGEMFFYRTEKCCAPILMQAEE